MSTVRQLSAPPVLSLVDEGRMVSPSRQLATSQTRRRAEVRRGNPGAMRHGVYATTANVPSVSIEIALTFEAHPDLDLILDARLVETYAITSTQWRRAIAAIDRDGWSMTMAKIENNVGARVERLERALQERVRDRRAEAKRSNVLEGRLSQYEQASSPSETALAAASAPKSVNHATDTLVPAAEPLAE